MAVILNIETATKNCSVCVAVDGVAKSIIELNEGQFSHAEKLHTFILEALQNAKLTMQDIDAVAVSKGPGSYTGLRIGVSAAKGLCFALDKPLISIPTLDSLAQAIKIKKGELIVPMIDARRLEVYCAVYNNQYQLLKNTTAKVINKDAFSSLLEGHRIYFLGDGADKCKTVINHPNTVFLDNYYPSAKEMARISFEKFNQRAFEDVAYFEPFYLKDFVAGKPKKQV